jgi:predicted Zn-ribbon and HTH transcriptional regulator
MTKQERIIKLLNQEELTLNRLLIFFEDNNLILDHKDLYEDLEKATENNKIIQEELAY